MENCSIKSDQIPTTITCDQEAWVRQTIDKAIDMVLAMDRLSMTRRDNELLKSAREGVVNGAAYQIIFTLPHLEPDYSNIRIPGAIRTLKNPIVDKLADSADCDKR